MNQSKFVGQMKNVTVERKDNNVLIKVLSNINFTLPAKSIIGLIGPSGGGKTTLLKTLVGLIPPKSGHVELGGCVDDKIMSSLPSSYIGYMPQETALNDIWTAQGILQFCGRVNNIDQDEINRRIQTLYESIDLPENLGFILSMSGGQKRRVSLAMALLHRPTLLILDEPTVGSDPISRLKIWKFLEKCRDIYGMTILVTTHYIEEVRNADTIAYMYSGCLIRHDKPQKLMEEFNCIELEKVALALCQSYCKSFPENNHHLTEESTCEDVFSNYDRLHVNSHHPPASSSQLIKASFIRISSEKYQNFVAPFLFSLWLHQSILMVLAFMQKPPIELSICISGSNTQFSSNLTMSFVESLDSSTQLNVLLCDLEEAQRKASHAQIIGYLMIDDNLGENLLDRVAIQETEEDPQPLWRFYGDYSQGVSIQFVERLLYQKANDFINGNLRNRNRTRPLYDLIDTIPIDGKPADEIDSRILLRTLPNILLYYAFQFCQACALFGFLFDRIDGFIDRQKVMGIKSWHLIVAHFLRANLYLMPMFVGTSIFLIWFLKIDFDQPILKFLVIHTIIAICGNSTGILLGTLSPSFSVHMVFLFSYHLGIMWFNSAIWPNEACPYYVNTLIHAFPFDNLAKSSVFLFLKQNISLSISLLAEPIVWTFSSLALSLWTFS
ncbi:uncharacterized protein LOC141855621 [Brevipalpus obovatus]|uniref:uncharacterized protein LOC141855621 n=1 Tax=Brevipalpus obovatus TaxID=246614 RepID=UPI003D9E34D9